MTGHKTNSKMPRSKVNRPGTSPKESKNLDDHKTVPDLSLLRKSIQTSITGFTQARNVFDTGTEELKNLLSLECDVIYECRVCRNLFRSLANFISHKRVYCRQKFNTSFHAHFVNKKFIKDDTLVILKNEEDYQQYLKNKKNGNIDSPAEHFDNVPPKNSSAKDLTSIIERLAKKNDNHVQHSKSDKKSKNEITNERYLKFQSIPTSNNVVYQNFYENKNGTEDLMKEQVAELDRMISSTEAVLGPDGKLINSYAASTSPDNQNHVSVIQISDEEDELSSQDSLFCKKCNIKFSTQKTLRFHMKHKHADNRLLFPCPDCSDSFSNAWSVYRHLFKIHRRSAAYIRKLRDSIQNKAYRLSKYSTQINKKKTVFPSVPEVITEQQRVDQENQAWMENLEGDGEIPRCGGCGRRFERRAALSSHRQTCQLRIAAHNKITHNLQRKGPKLPVEAEAPADVQPPAKIPKIDSKPNEKRIEIKIRRDYNKGSAVSLISAETSSSSIELASEGDRSSRLSYSPSGLGIGENSVTLSVYNSDNDKMQHKTCENMDVNDAVKDCDDAYVEEGSNKDSSVAHSSVKEEEKTVLKQKSEVEVDEELQIIDDGDLSFEDIRRICHKDELSKSPTHDLAEIGVVSIENTCAAAKNKMEPFPNSDDTVTSSQSAKDGYDDIVLENTKALDAEISLQGLPERLFCKQCKLNFNSIMLFRKHMARHLDWKKFKCKLCEFRTYNRSQCISHLQYQHKISFDQSKTDSLVRPLPPSQACLKRTYNEPNTSKLQTSGSVVVELSDDEDDEKQNSVQDESSEKASNQSIASASGDDQNSNGSRSSTIIVKKRGRPKGSKEYGKKKRMSTTRNEKDETISLDEDSPTIADLDEKKTTRITSLKKQKSFDLDLHSRVDPVEKSANKDNMSKRKSSLQSSKILDSDCIILQNDVREKETVNNLRIENQHIASNTSSTVRRPVRNRVKPLNKDFEYDLSNLLKLEAEAYKEYHAPPIISPKTPLKRKQFLQNEAVPVERPMEIPVLKEQPKQYKSPAKRCQGALQTQSLLAACRGRAHARALEAPTARREPPPFIPSRLRSSPVLPPNPDTSKTAPVKKVMAKSVLLLPTPSTTSEKSSSDKVEQTGGHPSILQTMIKSTENSPLKKRFKAAVSPIANKSTKKQINLKKNKCRDNDPPLLSANALKKLALKDTVEMGEEVPSNNILANSKPLPQMSSMESTKEPTETAIDVLENGSSDKSLACTKSIKDIADKMPSVKAMKDKIANCLTQNQEKISAKKKTFSPVTTPMKVKIAPESVCDPLALQENTLEDEIDVSDDSTVDVSTSSPIADNQEDKFDSNAGSSDVEEVSKEPENLDISSDNSISNTSLKEIMNYEETEYHLECVTSD